jgi:hypothetical protein
MGGKLLKRCGQFVCGNIQSSWEREFVGRSSGILMTLYMGQGNGWEVAEVLLDSLEDIPTGSKCIIWEVWSLLLCETVDCVDDCQVVTPYIYSQGWLLEVSGQKVKERSN